MNRGLEAVASGRALIGTRFLPQGRDRADGLDCVGLTLVAFAADGGAIPDDYRLAGDHRPAIVALTLRQFRRVARTRIMAGDLLLLRAGVRHWHLGIWTGEGLLHADARRAMVVERPGPPEWPVAAAFRARVRKQRKGV